MKALLLLVLTVWSASSSSSSSSSSSCSSSPSQWCSSLESAIQCGVLKQCLEANFTRSRQNVEPVELELYYESLCPGCRGFLTQMLFPTWIMLNDIFKVTLVPFGNADEKFDGKKYVFKCQHGEQECLGNMIETCVMNMTGEVAFQIIYCMEASTNVVKAAKSCVDLFAPSVSWDSIMTCVKGDLGNQLMHQNALKTTALNPPHEYVPWIIVNGQHTDALQDEAMSALYPMVCKMFKRQWDSSEQTTSIEPLLKPDLSCAVKRLFSGPLQLPRLSCRPSMQEEAEEEEGLSINSAPGIKTSRSLEIFTSCFSRAL
ncbi:gamma-interferon-inducible lysosomal thiol reductase-like [Diretmus argenteus]